MQHWEVCRALDPQSAHGKQADAEELGRLLADGWEPFGVATTAASNLAGPVYVYLRRITHSPE